MKILVTGGSGFIGTNLMEKLLESGAHQLLNLDISEPKDKSHLPYWKSCDIMDATALHAAFASFDPEAVIHLAARTDTDPENALDDYKVNTAGSENVLSAIRAQKRISRVIITSTQFVHQYQGLPKNDEDFAPHTVYGESKVMMEKMTRDANLHCCWTIIRPTNIWGPWHIRYPSEFWRIVSKGLYIHPGRSPVIRSYGYVGNVVYQMLAILTSPVAKVDKKVFYVGDLPIDLMDWVNGFSLKQRGKPVTVVPRFMIRMLAWAGDILSLVKLPFPITSSRFKSMTVSNVAPLEATYDAFGVPPYTLEQGIEETVNWMRQTHPELVKVPAPRS